MTKKLYVGNLPYSVDDHELAKLFSPFGEVVSAKVITERGSGRSKGFGFVEMPAEVVEEAIENLNGYEVAGRPLRVDEAKEPTDRGEDRGERRPFRNSRMR